MIVDRVNRLMDVAALSLYARRSPSMVKKYCDPVACDVASRILLYDADACAEFLKPFPRRKAEHQMAETYGWLDEGVSSGPWGSQPRRRRR